MARKDHYTLHPSNSSLQEEFYYGNMSVKRKSLADESKHTKRMVTIFDSYLKAGIFPAGTCLIGDYLEHTLTKNSRDEQEIAGRYLGLALPNDNYQYVRLEGESIGIEKHKLNPPDEINILTDTCLFCASNATATLENGEVVSIVAPKTRIISRIKSLEISENLCLYEMDAVVRLTDIIAAMKEGNTSFAKAIVAMPTVEYCFYLMEAYNKGFVEKEMMIHWIAQVNKHAEKIIAVMRKRIGLPIITCQPLDSVEYYIKETVDLGKPADFEKVKEILSEASHLWKEVLSITKPREWKQLNYTNYAIAVLKSAMANGNSNRLTIDIENPSEQRILRNAAKIAKTLGKQGSSDNFRVIGIYPHEKVFIPNMAECSQSFPRLYYLEQTQLAGKCYYREIVESNRSKVT